MRGVAYSLAERELLMKMHQQGKSFSMLSRDTGIARPVLSRWWMRYQQQGPAGLEPRSRRPRRSPYRLASGVHSEVLQLRERGWGPARIALALGIGHSSVHRVLVRHGNNRLRWPEQKTFRRYEKSRPGELVHVDLKYLYRWKNTQREYAFAAVDDFSREAVAQIRPARTSGDAAAFLERLVAALQYRIEAVMTDNDFIFTMRYACHSERQTRFQQACRSLRIEHWRARPRHPQSNGKVERFFRTLDEECFAVHRPRSSAILQSSAASSEPAWLDTSTTTPSLFSAGPAVTYVLGYHSERLGTPSVRAHTLDLLRWPLRRPHWLETP